MQAETSEHLRRFGFQEEPFAPTADPAYCYVTKQHEICLRDLWRCVENREGAAIALGGFGAGKTTMLRKMAAELFHRGEAYSAAVVGAPLSAWTSQELLAHIVRQFGLQPADTTAPGLCDAMNTHLLANLRRNCVLLIDDAHLLTRRGHLELLRILQTLETPSEKLLTILCFAHESWRETLDAAPGFAQHAGVVKTLEPVDLDGLESLITFRMRRAVASGTRKSPVFSRAAIAALHAGAGGNLRLVMNAARNALALACTQQRSIIDHEVVLEVFDTSMNLDNQARTRVAAALLSVLREVVPARPPREKGEGAVLSGRDVQAQATPASAKPAPIVYASERDKKAAEMLLKNVSFPGGRPGR